MEWSTKEMRQLSFTLYERMVLVPVELVLVMKSLLITGAALFVVFFLAAGYKAGLSAFIAFFGAVVTGTVVTPLLLPFLPSRSFAIKGACVGIIWSYCFHLLVGSGTIGNVAASAIFLALPAVSAFYAFNFTGCTNYTSLSGVNAEMRIGIPLMGSAVLASVVLLLISRFV